MYRNIEFILNMFVIYILVVFVRLPKFGMIGRCLLEKSLNVKHILRFLLINSI